jgi:hypothetical protein
VEIRPEQRLHLAALLWVEIRPEQRLHPPTEEFCKVKPALFWVEIRPEQRLWESVFVREKYLCIKAVKVENICKSCKNFQNPIYLIIFDSTYLKSILGEKGNASSATL